MYNINVCVNNVDWLLMLFCFYIDWQSVLKSKYQELKEIEQKEMKILESMFQVCFLSIDYCINGKICNVEIFGNFANPWNSWTFPTAYFVMPGKAQIYLSTNFRELRTFPHAKRLENPNLENFWTRVNIHFYSTSKLKIDHTIMW